MVMPSPAELRRLRADIEDAVLPSVGNILSATETRDGEGGITLTWGTALANVACRLDSVKKNFGVGIEAEHAASIKPYSTWILTLPYGTAITTYNRFEFGSDTYNVIEVNSNSSWLPNVRATLERI